MCVQNSTGNTCCYCNNMTRLKEHHLQQRWFDCVKDGRKTVEVRLYRGDWVDVQSGQIIHFRSDTNERVTVLVTDVNHFTNLSTLFQCHSISSCLPGVTDLDTALQIYHQIYSEQDIQEAGVIALEICKMDEPALFCCVCDCFVSDDTCHSCQQIVCLDCCKRCYCCDETCCLNHLVNFEPYDNGYCRWTVYICRECLFNRFKNST